MNGHALLVLGALMSFVASAVAVSLWIVPRLRMKNRIEALVPLVAHHMFFLTIALSFLVPGVVSPLLPNVFAVPAGYGDLVAGILAIIATPALARRARLAPGLVWVFNVRGAGDLLNAIYQGNVRVKLDPGRHSTFRRQSSHHCWSRTDLLASASAGKRRDQRKGKFLRTRGASTWFAQTEVN